MVCVRVCPLQLLLCDWCPAAYHPRCIGLGEKDVANMRSRAWACPHHECMECSRKAAAVGGLIFRCELCPNSYCEDHLPIDADIVGHCERFESLGMRHPDQACFIHCSGYELGGFFDINNSCSKALFLLFPF